MIVDPASWRWAPRLLRSGRTAQRHPIMEWDVVDSAETVVAAALLRPRDWSDRTRDRYEACPESELRPRGLAIDPDDDRRRRPR